MFPILARTVIQIVGAPKVHVEETLKLYIENIKKDKAFEVIKTKFAEAEEKDGLFNSYVEIELRVKDTPSLVWFCFDYMPASIEVLEPSELTYSQHELSGFLNDLQARLHQLDLMAKNLHAENKVLKNNGMILIKNLIKVSLRDGEKNLEEIAKLTGMPEDHVKKFIRALVKEGKIKETKGKYRLV